MGSFIFDLDLKPKVGCFGSKSGQVILVTSRRLQVDPQVTKFRVKWSLECADRSDSQV